MIDHVLMNKSVQSVEVAVVKASFGRFNNAFHVIHH